LPATILQKIDYDRLIQSFIVNKLDDFVGVEGMEMQFVLEGKKTTLHDFFSVRDDILDKWSNITKEIPDVEIVEDSDE
jgi:hypothetical protein